MSQMNWQIRMKFRRRGAVTKSIHSWGDANELWKKALPPKSTCPSTQLAGVTFNRCNTAIVYIVVKLWSATVGLGEVFASLSLSST